MGAEKSETGSTINSFKQRDVEKKREREMKNQQGLVLLVLVLKCET